MYFLNKYKNKNVIITGHTGFKGSWLAVWLNLLGANVTGISNNIPTCPSNFEASNIKKNIKEYRVDITDRKKIIDIIKKINPDFVFNLAAQSLVRRSYEFPADTFLTNAIGSINILEAVRLNNKKTNCIMITSDKVYLNKELKRGYVENDTIMGKDPYSGSKSMAEIAIHSYVQSFFLNSSISVVTARAGNVIGGGDWAEDRIVPDSIKAWSKNKEVIIRNPDSTRPWQHVLEPLSGYLLLGALMNDKPELNGKSYNFGPPDKNDFSVKILIETMSNYWPNSSWKIKDIKNKSIKEAGLLKLNCKKAKKELKWAPVLNFEETVSMTVKWYKDYYQKEKKSMNDFSLLQIKEYTEFARSKNLQWAK